MTFRSVTLSEFTDAVSAVRFPRALEDAYGKLDHDMIFDTRLRDPEMTSCMIHDGSLTLQGHFKAPAFHVLIDGDLTVDGIVDTNFEGDDEGGSFFVTGNVTCNVYLSHYGKVGIFGGDLNARDLILSAYQDSLLCVGGTIRTFFFFGHDVWAEFGERAELQYGNGYCLPLHHVDAQEEGVEPFFGEEESYRLLAIENPDDCDTWEIAEHIRLGKPIFRPGVKAPE
jgi:hypothetical protein